MRQVCTTLPHPSQHSKGPALVKKVIAQTAVQYTLPEVHYDCVLTRLALKSTVYAGKDEGGVAKYDARIMYAIPTPGLAEVEPSMSWNPSVVAGIGVVADPAVLYNDMHSYLASSGDTPSCHSASMLVDALICIPKNMPHVSAGFTHVRGFA